MAPRNYAERALAHHGVRVPVLVAYYDVRNRKPHPEPILRAAEQLGLRPQHCVYIGDAATDLVAADSAGAVPIGGDMVPVDPISQTERQRRAQQRHRPSLLCNLCQLHYASEQQRWGRYPSEEDYEASVVTDHMRRIAIDALRGTTLGVAIRVWTTRLVAIDNPSGALGARTTTRQCPGMFMGRVIGGIGAIGDGMPGAIDGVHYWRIERARYARRHTVREP